MNKVSGYQVVSCVLGDNLKTFNVILLYDFSGCFIVDLKSFYIKIYLSLLYFTASIIKNT